MVLPDWQMAMRDDDYKLVRKQTTDYDSTAKACVTTPATEFYAIDQDRLPRLKLDNAPDNLLGPHRRLSRSSARRCPRWTAQLDQLLASQVPAPATATSTASSIRRTSISSTTGPT